MAAGPTLYPNGDVTTEWEVIEPAVPGTYYTTIDELGPDDADYIETTSLDKEVRFTLTDDGSPMITRVDLRLRGKIHNGGNPNAKIRAELFHLGVSLGTLDYTRADFGGVGVIATVPKSWEGLQIADPTSFELALYFTEVA
jgi:hypothetical protein